MELLRSVSGSSAVPLTCLLLVALHGWPGAGAQEDESFQLWQPQEQVSVSVGQTLTLHCTVSKHAMAGPVKWLKAFGSSKQIVYDQKGPLPRVTRAVNESNTNYTIHISKVRVEDAGTYYCVKFKKGEEQDEEYSSGAGTEVFVHASPTSVAVSGPEHRAEPGSLVRFTCTAGGFFPRDISVEWLKNGAPVRALGPWVTAGQTNSSYDMVSAVELTLRAADIRSQLTCVVKHSTLPAPLRQTYNLSDAVRVPPTVRVLPDLPNPVEVNKTVNFTCSAEGFYPDAVTLTWLENGVEANAGSPPHLTETSQGTFELRSLLEVQATEEKNQSVFTCRVVHDSQSPVSSAVTLQIAVPAADRGPNNESLAGNLTLIYIAVGVICTVLALLVIAILYLIRAKQSKGKSSPSVRLHEPEKSSGAATQESDHNNLTYADLNFDKEKKSIRRIIEMSQQSEYACIQTSQAPATEDNLTYADLDMVHLSKAPKRPAPRPEEAGSEYASVQIQRK